jgi:hypothetical protein
MPNIPTEIEKLIREFTNRIEAVARAQSAERLFSVVAGALGTSGKGAPQAASAKATKAAPKPAVPGKRKLNLSAKGMAARKLQGQYLGILRGLKPGLRARVKKVAHEKGVAEAIKFAGSLK